MQLIAFVVLGHVDTNTIKPGIGMSQAMTNTPKTPVNDGERTAPGTGYEHYTENQYGRTVRTTNQEYRNRLTSWQVPAIQHHFGDLTGKVFLDIGAGDIVLGERLADIGTPATFYAQDLSEPSIRAGLERLREAGIPTHNIVTLCSDNFDFDIIPDGTIDAAFSNSLFSHLAINSILMCLRRLAPKMKPGTRYLSSMIVVPPEAEGAPYDWSYLGTRGSAIVSHPARDPYHYAQDTVFALSSFATGFDVTEVHDYGHPFQKLVEFRIRGD